MENRKADKTRIEEIGGKRKKERKEKASDGRSENDRKNKRREGE